MNSNKKEYFVSARCTRKQYGRIQSEAKKRGIKISEYLLDTKAGSNYGRGKLKRDLPILVDLQESANELGLYISEHPDISPLVMKNINKVIEGVALLWES